MTTTRSIRDSLTNVLDYLLLAELALYTNPVSMDDYRVGFHPQSMASPFLIGHGHPTVEQYVAWLEAGAYSALLFDASLLQVSYGVESGVVTRHRLAYIPCPYDVDTGLLADGEPAADVVELYRSGSPVLRSPIRFDFDPKAAAPGHPAAHITFNGTDCRIACAAPVHVLRFVDFVFRNFYPALWSAHAPFFSDASYSHIGSPALTDADRRNVHLAWDVHARAAG